MTATGYSWAGIRAESFEETVRFFEQLFGFSSDASGENVAIFSLPSGQKFEIIGPDSSWASLHERPVLAFDVEDIVATKQDLEDRGTTFLTGIEVNGSGSAFCYFIGPDGFIYSLSQKPLKESETIVSNMENAAS